jgi:hypothetical protein
MAVMTTFIPMERGDVERIDAGDVELRRELKKMILDALNDLSRTRDDAPILESVRRIDPADKGIDLPGFCFTAEGANPNVTS